jgi:ABC-type multidrug transport system fused ATPase/permease subunit
MKDKPLILNSLQRLWAHIKIPRRRQLYVLFIIILIASLSEVISIGAVLPFLGILLNPERVLSQPLLHPFLEKFNLQDEHQLMLLLTIIFISAALFSGAMRLALHWTQTRLCFAIGADISYQLYRNALYQPYSVHVSRNTSEVITAISTKSNTVIYNTLLPFMFMVSSSIILVSILIVLITIDPKLALSTIGGLGGIYTTIMFITKKRLSLDSQSISFQNNQVIKSLQEGLGGIRDVLIDGTQSAYCEIYRNADIPLRNSQANIMIIAGSPRFIIEAFGISLIAMLAYGLANSATGIASAIPLLGAYAVGAQRLLPVLQQLFHNWANLRGGYEPMQDVLNLLEQPLTSYESVSSIEPLKFQKSIILDQVAFRYDETRPWVLQKINIKIPKGSRIGFMGTTGSGKSTLLDVLMGLLQPTEGQVLIDGVPITMQNCRSWQTHIAHVPQSIFLTDATISENIAFGIPPEKIDHTRVKFAAGQAQLACTIESWEKNYDTRVGERGIRLSGGQRQRIGIARALYKQTSIIIFDEATSALDHDTERAVMQAIDNISQDITIIMVAHRLTTLRNCDRIIQLEQGLVKRTGSFSKITEELEFS